MKIKYNINFRLEKRKNDNGDLIELNVPIFSDITWQGNRLHFFSGHRINFSQWLDKDEQGERIQRVKKNSINKAELSSSEINQELSNLEAVIKSIFEYFGGIEEIPSKEQIKHELKERLKKTSNPVQSDLFESFENYCKEAKVSKERRRHIYSTKNHFERFSKTLRHKLTFENCTVETIKLFERYLAQERKEEKPKSQNTISGILKKLRAFFRYSKHPEVFKDFKIEPENYGDPICLTKEERDLLYYAEIKDEQAALVRDMFVLQCLIGARVGDFLRLKRENIIDNYIQYIAHKTKDDDGSVIRVPLSKKALDIINKHDLLDGRLLPFLNLKDYNEIIKHVFRVAGITRNVVRLNPLTRENEIVPINTIASSHLARRTFIDIMHKAGVKNEIIASMTGHVENSRSFLRYRTIDDGLRKNAINAIE